MPGEAYSRLTQIFSEWTELYYHLDYLQPRKWTSEGQDLAKIVEDIKATRLKQKLLLSNYDALNLLDLAGKENLTPVERANLREMRRWAIHTMSPSNQSIIDLEDAMQSSEWGWLDSFEYAQEHGKSKAWEDLVKPRIREMFARRREYAREIAQNLGCKPSEVALDEWNPHMRNTDIAKLAKEARQNGMFRKMFERTAEFYKTQPEVLPITFDPEIFTKEKILSFVEKMKNSVLNAMELSDQERAKTKTVMGLMENPFCWGTPEDIMVTVEHRPDFGFLTTVGNGMHELGHMAYLISTGRYPEGMKGQPVGLLNGYGIHELSAMYFEQLSLTPQFFKIIGPVIREHFGVDGPEFSDENLYRAAITPSFDNPNWGSSELALLPNMLWRVEAEQALLDAETDEEFNQVIDSLPQRWAETMTELTGVAHDPADFEIDASHWFDRQTGYFWAYVQGGMAASAIHRNFETSDLAQSAETAATLEDLLRPHMKNMQDLVFQYGSIFTPMELVERAVGHAPTVQEYVENRYPEVFENRPSAHTYRLEPALV